MRGKLVVMIGIVVMSVVTGGVALAQAASALVLEMSGPTIPDLQPYSEIPPDKTISLPSGARLVFLHYKTCRTVTVVGSTVIFGAWKYNITGGTKELDVETPCPRQVALKSGGELAGTLLRNLLVLSIQPTFVVVGERAGNMASVRVSKGDKVVLDAPLEGRHFSWPAGAAPLAVNSEYNLALIPSAAGATPVMMKFKAVTPAKDPTRKALTVIRVE